MNQLMEFIIGILVVSTGCSVASALIWQKTAAPNNTGKQIFFALVSFAVGGLLGLLGGIPMLIVSWVVARSYKTKKQPAHSQKLHGEAA
jgi:predicted dinucleotide-utilizing enzyme